MKGIHLLFEDTESSKLLIEIKFYLNGLCLLFSAPTFFPLTDYESLEFEGTMLVEVSRRFLLHNII